ncbi:MAG: putative dehydrogenase [Limisphaerales bacterium]|jgi:predicted dehydrogenase
MKETTAPLRISRRNFLRNSSAMAGMAATAPYVGWSSTASGAAPSKDLRFACLGAHGRARRNIAGMATVPNTTMVAVAEVDSGRLDFVNEQSPNTKIYKDWRVLLEKEAAGLDAVIVSTPDHMHAPMAMTAMQAGLNVYCEKPLTRTVFEARALRLFAEQNGIITQMGNQRSQHTANQTVVHALRNRLVGTVKEIHCLQDKSWGSMAALVDSGAPKPKGLDWDLWIGGSPMRPFMADHFHPFAWRSRLNYGCGNLGDMGCHIFHPWFLGLQPGSPLTVESLGKGPANAESWPTDVRVTWEFPGSKVSGGKKFNVTWHDGGQQAPAHVAKAVGGVPNVPKSGSIVIGTKGTLVSPHGGSTIPTLYVDGSLQKDAVEIIPGAERHHLDFANAVRGENGGKSPLSHFGHGARMTEAVLLGTCAIRTPGMKLRWDADALKFTNSEVASSFVRDEYREGWQVAGL